MRMRGMRGQVWVETMIYTMVAFFMIGIVLAFVRPKILEFQDRVVIERSINTMDEIHQNVLSVARGGDGNRRAITIDVKKGSLEINGTDDAIILEVHESHYEYSEPGHGVNVGQIRILTEKAEGLNRVTLTLNYSGRYNLTYRDEDGLFQAGISFTHLSIENKGGSDPRINFEIN